MDAKDIALIKALGGGGSGGSGGSITVDRELSATSTNPVQNKVIKSALDALSEEIANLGGGLLTVETITIGEESGGTVAVTGLTLDLSTYSATVGDGFYINPVVSPTNATNKAVTWESNATNIATVDNSGYVECLAEGSAVITCTTVDGGYTATCAVSVAADSSGGDTGDDGGDTTGGKVQFSTLGLESGLLKADGTPVSLGSTYHVTVPYTDGMFVSTGMNAGWNTSTYPPFIVYDGSAYSAPSFTMADSTVGVGGKTVTQFTATLTGYGENAVVYANIYSGDTGGSVETAMNDSGIYYYIPGGET